MIKQLSFSDLHESLGYGELVPQAILSVPVSYFAERFEFIQDEDDLDRFEGAAFVFNDSIPLEIKHYAGHPDGTVTLYLLKNDNLEDVHSLVRGIVSELDLLDDAIYWERSRDPFY